MKRIILLSVIMFALLMPNLSANTIREIKGRVADINNEGIAYATVCFIKDSVNVNWATTDSLGIFKLKIVPANYLLQISHISYQSIKTEIEINNHTNYIGIFKLENADKAIKEVVVTATSLSREADRFVLSITDSKQLAGRDGTEILAQAPGVWIDDSGIAINGMQGSKVYINDRELKLAGENLISYLRGLSSSDIARIEVIPQAGAEYSADSKGGIIKIILRKKLENGINGSLQFNILQGKNTASYNPLGNIYAKTGKWNINASASGGFMTKGEGNYITSREYISEGSNFFGVSHMNTKRNNGIGRVGVIYDINSAHNMGVEVEYSKNKYEIPSEAETYIIQNGIEIQNGSRYDQRSNKDNISATFNYIWNIDSLGSSLKFITDYTRQTISGHNNYNTFFEVDGFGRDSLSRSNNSSKYNIITTELALKKVLCKNFIFNAGLKYTRNDMEDITLFEGKTPTGWVLYKDYSYLLNYTENIGAAYATLQANIKRWSLSAGLRGEYTNINKSYFRLFPNLSVSYAFNNTRTWMLIAQYSNNIERPGFLAMNPTRIQYSDYNYQIGNPLLRPTYIHKISATAVFKYRYSFTVGANIHKDLIREVSKIDPSNANVTYVTPENHYMENHYFIALNMPFMPTTWWNFTANFVGVKQDIKFVKESGVLSHYLMFANVTSGFTLPAKFYAEVSYKGNSKLYSGNSGVGSRHIFDAAIKKGILKDKMTLSLSVHNIFDSKTEYFSVTDKFVNTMRGYSELDSRYFKISITYNFRTGKSFKAKKLESSALEERGRL